MIGEKNIIFDGASTHIHELLLVVDIGGTNCNLGIYAEPGHFLWVTYRYPSQQISDFTQFISDFSRVVSQELHKPITGVVCAAAGAVYPGQHQVRLTNLGITIDSPAAARVLGIPPENFLVCNDFTAVALGYPLVNPEQILSIHDVAERRQGQKAFIGAGTGLGVAGLVWNTKLDRYIPVVSEGGHMDFCPENGFDLALADYHRHVRSFASPVSWEDILSGSGISTLYAFLGTQRTYARTQVTDEIEGRRFQPDYISRYAHHDEQCRDTFALYLQYYARCVKVCALMYSATGGIYIAGGIAARNKELFLSTQFLRHFLASEKQHTLLQKVPIYLIQDYSVSLYGAAEYARLQGLL